MAFAHHLWQGLPKRWPRRGQGRLHPIARAAANPSMKSDRAPGEMPLSVLPAPSPAGENQNYFGVTRAGAGSALSRQSGHKAAARHHPTAGVEIDSRKPGAGCAARRTPAIIAIAAPTARSAARVSLAEQPLEHRSPTSSSLHHPSAPTPQQLRRQAPGANACESATFHPDQQGEESAQAAIPRFDQSPTNLLASSGELQVRLRKRWICSLSWW